MQNHQRRFLHGFWFLLFFIRIIHDLLIFLISDSASSAVSRNNWISPFFFRTESTSYLVFFFLNCSILEPERIPSKTLRHNSFSETRALEVGRSKLETEKYSFLRKSCTFEETVFFTLIYMHDKYCKWQKTEERFWKKMQSKFQVNWTNTAKVEVHTSNLAISRRFWEKHGWLFFYKRWSYIYRRSAFLTKSTFSLSLCNHHLSFFFYYYFR